MQADFPKRFIFNKIKKFSTKKYINKIQTIKNKFKLSIAFTNNLGIVHFAVPNAE